MEVSGPGCRDYLVLIGLGMLPRRRQDMVKHRCSGELTNLPRTGKAEHASCGQGQGLPRSRQWMGKTGVTRADSDLHLAKQVSTRNELNCDVPIVI